MINLTDFHAKYFAHELTKRSSSDSVEMLAGVLADAQVELNPHQVEAALFAFRNPFSRGAILADSGRQSLSCQGTRRDRLVIAGASNACGCRVLGALDDEDPEADRKLPKAISPVDPCSAWTTKANKRVQFGYGLNYLIDIKHAVIVDVEATPARTYDEVAATKTMIKRTEQTQGLKPKRLLADTAYGTGKFLGWLIETGTTLISRSGIRAVVGRRHLLKQRLHVRP